MNGTVTAATSGTEGNEKAGARITTIPFQQSPTLSVSWAAPSCSSETSGGVDGIEVGVVALPLDEEHLVVRLAAPVPAALVVAAAAEAVQWEA